MASSIPLVKFQRSGAMDTETDNKVPTAEEFKTFLTSNFELIMETFADFEKAVIDVSDDPQNEALRRIAFEELAKFYTRMQLGREKFSISLMEIRLKNGDRRGDEKLKFGFTAGSDPEPRN